MNWVWLFCDDLVQSFTPVRSNFHFLIFYIYLLDYFQMSMLASLRRSSSRGHNTVGVESLMGSFVLAGFMECPVLVEVAAGAQGAQPAIQPRHRSDSSGRRLPPGRGMRVGIEIRRA